MESGIQETDLRLAYLSVESDGIGHYYKILLYIQKCHVEIQETCWVLDTVDNDFGCPEWHCLYIIIWHKIEIRINHVEHVLKVFSLKINLMVQILYTHIFMYMICSIYDDA